MNREDEIKEIQERMSADQRRLDELLSDMWPKEGDKYWNTLNPNIDCLSWDGTDNERDWFSFGLLHRTQEDAQMHHELMKVVQELRECDGFRPFVVGKDNWSFSYEVGTNTSEDTVWQTSDCGWEHLYYRTREQRDAALAKVGRASVLKAMQWAAGRGR